VSTTQQAARLAERRFPSVHAIAPPGISHAMYCAENSADSASSHDIDASQPVPISRRRNPRQLHHNETGAAIANNATAVSSLIDPTRHDPLSIRGGSRPTACTRLPTMLSICQPRAWRNVMTSTIARASATSRMAAAATTAMPTARTIARAFNRRSLTNAAAKTSGQIFSSTPAASAIRAERTRRCHHAATASVAAASDQKSIRLNSRPAIGDATST